MRVVFLGTPEFALPSLEALADSSSEIAAVITQPDRPAGRGQKASPPAVKTRALARGLPVYQPERIRSEENRALLEALRPDFLVVVAYGQILPRWLLDLPAVAPVNVHASLLPLYRGAAPVAWALLRGDPVTGCTTMLMEETLDTGPILLARSLPVTQDATCGELERALARLGAELLLPTLDGLAAGRIYPRPQDDRQAVAAPKITKEMARIDWHRPSVEIHNRVRAFNPWPLARVRFHGQDLLVARTRPAGAEPEEPGAPGTVVSLTSDALRVRCGGGTALDLLEVQVAGRKRVSGRDFASGFRLRPGDTLSG